MLVLLPPSETKAAGGRGAALDLAQLTLAEVTPTRESLIEAVTALSGDEAAARAALGLGAGQTDELARNAALRTAPTTPALYRYTGVLYDALDAKNFTRVQKSKAFARLMIGSALFGAVGAADPIPAYRLSANSKLPGFGTLAALWKPHLSAALAAHAGDQLIVDLRSGGYQQLGPVPGAVTATVVTEAADGSRSVVSHFNKHHKGLLARALVLTRAEPTDAKAVARVAKAAGLRAETDGDLITIVTNGPDH